ncbi:MAG: Nucleoside diphosphate kinase [Spirochaetes bacterium ADurb.BinA120]|nr:MAG: Nucleoside diphosphate kinase [Spirochaetes bacterium ADurb.BinA120]HPV97833.1 nucleoside-diphosphate kinase [Spirochaetota bacterium]
MPRERTLSIVKPDAVGKNLIGEIYARFEKNGLRIAAARMLRLSRDDARRFYAEHEGQPYYEPLIDFMTSGPILAQVLEGDDAINKNREIMGKTNSPEADPGTIRRDYGENNRRNAVHGSDSPKSAEREIAFFFGPEEVFDRW